MLKIKKLSLVLALTIFSIGMIACGGTVTVDNKPAANKAENAANKAENAANKAENAANRAENAANKAANDKPADNKETASGDKIGVPECDEYIDKYEACIMSKMPEAARAASKSALDQSRKAWKDAASTPQGKAGLATGCKAALDAAKQATTAYGCTW